MSYVAMEKNVCPACGITHEHNTGILLHKNLKDIPEDKTITGWGLCEKHQNFVDDGYIILVAIENQPEGAVDPGDVERTGSIAYLRESAWEHLFDAPTPINKLAFVEQEVLTMLKEMQEEEAQTVH